jgi:hypothetical protein
MIIALMMETVRTSETSVRFNVTTRRYNPEDSKLRVHNCFSSHRLSKNQNIEIQKTKIVLTTFHGSEMLTLSVREKINLGPLRTKS